MQSYHRLGSMFGIEIGLHVSWYIIVFLISVSLATSFFPVQVPGQSTGAYAFLGIVSASLLFVSVVLHELAHSLMAQSFRLHIDRIYLFFFGGISQIDEEGLTPTSEIVMALAGPVFSILLGVVLLMLQSLMGQSVIQSPMVMAVVKYLGQVNLALGLFNLIPGFPLDGGRVMRGIMWWYTGRVDIATWYASRAGKVFGALLAVLGIISMGFGDAGGLWMVFVGIFLYVIAESSFEQFSLKKSLSGKKVRNVVEKNPISVSSSHSVDRLINNYFSHLSIDHLAVVDNKRFLGVVNLDRIARIHPNARHAIKVKDVMVPLAKMPVLASQDSLFFALQKMAQARMDLLPVMKASSFKGVVSRESIIHLLRTSSLREEKG